MLKIKTLSALVALAFANVVIAAPTGGTFRPGFGSGSISTSGATTDVVVTGTAPFSSLAVIDWASFSVANGETVNFTHNNNRSVLNLINVDNSGAMSQINGALNTINGASAPSGATVNLFVVNPNGVSIGSTAAINTSGSFIAAAGSVDSVTPVNLPTSGTPKVTIRLNSSPVTVFPSATITAVGGAHTNGLDWNMVATGAITTLPAVFGLTTIDLATAGDGTGKTFNMANSAESGMTLTLPVNSVLNINDSVLSGNSSVTFLELVSAPNNYGYGNGTANLSNLTVKDGTFALKAKTGASLNSGAVTLASGGNLDLSSWLGTVNLNGAITGSGGNALTLRYGGLGFASPLTVNNADVSFVAAGAFASVNDASFTPATDFYTGAGKAGVTVNGGSLSVTAPSGSRFNNASVTADSVTISANDIRNADVTSAGSVSLSAVGFGPGSNLAIGSDGSTVSVTGGTVSAQAFSGDVTVGANSTLRATTGTDVLVNGFTSVSYQAGSHQLAQGVNAVSSGTINGAGLVDARTALQQNPAMPPFGAAVSIMGQNVTIAGTVQAGTPPTPPVVPPVVPTTPTTPDVTRPDFKPVSTQASGNVEAPTVHRADLLLPAPKHEMGSVMVASAGPDVVMLTVTPSAPAQASAAAEAMPVKVAQPVQYTVSTVEADALFEFGKATLTSEARHVLDQVIASMNDETQQAGRKIVIGHADRIGKAKTNDRLSLARAEAVKAYLVEKGIPANTVKTEGRGSRQPLSKPGQCGTGKAAASCLAADRRVEFKVANPS